MSIRNEIARASALLIAATAVVTLALIGAGGWHYWTGTIHYSLSQLAIAVRQHDRYLFEKHVDLKPITRHVVDELLQAEFKELENEPLSALEQAVAPIGLAFVQMLKPRMVEELEYAVTRGVESGSLELGKLSEEKSGTSSDQKVEDLLAEMRSELPQLKPGKLAGIRRTGNRAIVSLDTQLEGGLSGEAALAPSIKVRFDRTPDRYWRATEIENFTEILKFWKGLEQKRLDLANIPIRRMIQDSVGVMEVTKEQGLNATGTGKDAWVVATLHNNMGSGVQGLIADVTIRDAGGELKKIQIQDPDPIPPKESKRMVWPLGLNLFDEVDRVIYNADPRDLVIAIEIRHVAFSDGTSIKLAESLDEVPGSARARRPAAPAAPAQAPPIEAL